MFSLIMSSEPHLKALIKVLNESYIMPNTISDKVEYLVNQIQATNYITFKDDEIDLVSTWHTKALYISLKCKGYTITKVLIDNRFALNVLLMVTLE